MIDLAKIISIAYSNNCSTVKEVLSNKKLKNRIDLIFIPTTVGSGSEATTFAVMYKNKTKYSLNNKSIEPKYVILDPKLLNSLPNKILHYTMLDALAHSIESIWAVAGTAKSKYYAKEAIKLILSSMSNHNTINRLDDLQLGSHLAGKAINISRTTIPHSISYPLSSYFKIHHGLAVFLILPSMVKLNFHTNEYDINKNTRLSSINKSYSTLFKLFEVKNIKSFYNKLNTILTDFGFSPRLRDYHIKKEDLKLITENSINMERWKNNPRKITKKYILKSLKEIY